MRALSAQRIAWSEIGAVRLRELRVGVVRGTVPVLVTSTGESTVWNGRLLSLRSSVASAHREELAETVARRLD